MSVFTYWPWTTGRLDNVKIYMYKYTKFKPNIPCGSRVIGVFTNNNRQMTGWSAKPRPF